MGWPEKSITRLWGVSGGTGALQDRHGDAEGRSGCVATAGIPWASRWQEPPHGLRNPRLFPNRTTVQRNQPRLGWWCRGGRLRPSEPSGVLLLHLRGDRSRSDSVHCLWDPYSVPCAVSAFVSRASSTCRARSKACNGRPRSPSPRGIAQSSSGSGATGLRRINRSVAHRVEEGVDIFLSPERRGRKPTLAHLDCRGAARRELADPDRREHRSDRRFQTPKAAKPRCCVLGTLAGHRERPPLEAIHHVYHLAGNLLRGWAGHVGG